MAINAQEISALIKQQIENFKPNFDVTETGVVTYIGMVSRVLTALKMP
ncbi:F0F1 ATP synthase subunit alpha [Streptococcus pneumoniae SP18-BS74]|nr:F0F1 ATP synthase subunit alpha [Streptococcus pneumoniae SP18-BS74]